MIIHGQIHGDCVAFLEVDGVLPRVVVLVGKPGSGKSYLTSLVASSLARDGVSCTVIDGLEEDPRPQIEAIAQGLVSGGTRHLMVACRHIPSLLKEVLDRHSERRILTLGPIDDQCARDMLAEAGFDHWSLSVAAAIRQGGGNPRQILDAVFSQPANGPGDDRTLQSRPGREAIIAWQRAWYACDTLERRAIAERAMAADAMGVEALTIASDEALIRWDVTRSIEVSRQALASAQRAVDPWWLIRTAINDAFGRSLQHDPSGVQNLFLLASRAERTGAHDVAALCWQRVFGVFFSRGDLQLARQACERAMCAADTAGATTHALALRVSYADILLEQGAGHQARIYLDEVMRQSGDDRRSLPFLQAAASLAGYLLKIEDHVTGREVAEEAYARMPESCDVLLRDMVRVIVSRARSLTADISGALMVLGEPGDCISCDDAPGQEYYLALEAVRVLARGGHPSSDADPWIAMLRSFPDTGIGGSVEAARLEAQALRYAMAKDRVMATRLVEHAIHLWLECGCNEEANTCRALAGALDIVAGTRPGEGAVSLTATVVDADGSVDSARVASLSGYGDLTPREREIALMVASGMTNPEVAAELFLSVRTVEHHVARILRKLDIRSRRELVRRNRSAV